MKSSFNIAFFILDYKEFNLGFEYPRCQSFYLTLAQNLQFFSWQFIDELKILISVFGDQISSYKVLKIASKKEHIKLLIKYFKNLTQI